MRWVLIFLCIGLWGGSLDEIYANKKEQINKEFDNIDTARQELEAYRAATKAIFDKREAKVLKQEAEVNKTLADISKKEENIKNMLEQNEKILNELKNLTKNKVLQAYANMKDGVAAGIIAALPREEAAKILYSLEAKKISGIFGKMDPGVAAELTELLKKDEFFKQKTKAEGRGELEGKDLESEHASEGEDKAEVNARERESEEGSSKLGGV